MKHLPVRIAALSVVMISSVAACYAADRDDDEPRGEDAAFLAASVSLGDAVRVAEESTGGRAISGEFEYEDDQWAYSIEVLRADSSEMEVIVDPASGIVLETEEEDEEDEEDED